MIVITGPGRSGTSVLARLYAELGFAVGGTWHADLQAGLEDEELVEANRKIAHRLSITTNVGRTTPALHALAGSARVPGAIRRGAERLVLHRTAASVGRIDWAARDRVAGELAPDLRALAGARQVGKDPLFVYTLATWALAGAAPSAVVLSMRSIDASVESRAAAGLQRNLARDALANSLTFGVGMCMFAVAEHDIPLHVVRFPDFLDDPACLHSALPFPEPVSHDAFIDAFGRVVDRTNVRFGR